MNHVWVVFERDWDGDFYISIHRTRASARSGLHRCRIERTREWDEIQKVSTFYRNEKDHHKGFYIRKIEVLG